MQASVKFLFLVLFRMLRNSCLRTVSAHVIIAEKLLGLDPSTPEMTFLLVTNLRDLLEDAAMTARARGFSSRIHLASDLG